MQRLFVALLALAVVAAPSAQALACVCDQPAEPTCCAPDSASCCGCCPDEGDEDVAGVRDCPCTEVPPRTAADTGPGLDLDAPASLPLLESEAPAAPAGAHVSAARGEVRPAFNRPLLV